MISQMGLAVPAPINLAAVEVDIVGETHVVVLVGGGDVGVVTVVAGSGCRS